MEHVAVTENILGWAQAEGLLKTQKGKFPVHLAGAQYGKQFQQVGAKPKIQMEAWWGHVGGNKGWRGQGPAYGGMTLRVQVASGILAWGRRQDTIS